MLRGKQLLSPSSYPFVLQLRYKLLFVSLNQSVRLLHCNQQFLYLGVCSLWDQGSPRVLNRTTPSNSCMSCTHRLLQPLLSRVPQDHQSGLVSCKSTMRHGIFLMTQERGSFLFLVVRFHSIFQSPQSVPIAKGQYPFVQCSLTDAKNTGAVFCLARDRSG